MNKFLLLLAIFLFSSCSESVINPVEESDDGDLYLHVIPVSGSNYNQARFALHVPEFTGNLRGILVIVPGYNSDGRPYKDEPVFNEFAREERLAIISCYFVGDSYAFTYYDHADEGSGQALLRVIDEFALRKEMPELREAPLVFWGHSAGGMFSYAFANWKPYMVAACTPVRSSDFTEEPSDSVKYVPMMFLNGQYDNQDWLQECVDFCVNQRAENALWGYAIEPDAGHSIANSTDLSLPYLSSVLRMRVGEGVNNYTEMLPVNEEDGWLGNYYSKRIYSYQDYPNEKLDAAWLPDSSAANAWENYCKGIFLE